MRRLTRPSLLPAFVCACVLLLPCTETASATARSEPGIKGIAIPASTLQQDADTSDGGTFADVDEETARKLVRGCTLPREVSSPPGTPGSQTVLQIRVSEQGKLLTAHRVQGVLPHQLGIVLSTCSFKPYKVNGLKTAFRANITMTVK